MRPTSWAALAAVTLGFLGLLGTREVRAGTVQRFGLADLAERAEVAFEGRVQAVRVLEARPGRIETEYLISESAVHVGESCSTRIVRLPGGVLPDGRGLVLAGMPKLALGEDVLLFLSRESSQGTRMPVGLSQGALRVVTLPSGARRLVGSSAGLDIVGASMTAIPDGPGIDYVAGLAEISSGIAARAVGGGR
jgi:hypothetical protein